jgi:hypothetical protein
LHQLVDQTIGFLNGLARIVNEPHLDVSPSPLEISGFVGRE